MEGNPDNIGSLTAGSFTLVMRNTSTNPVKDTNGTGTITIVSSNPAVISYTFSQADVSAPFTGVLFIHAVFPGNLVAIWDPINFVITDD